MNTNFEGVGVPLQKDMGQILQLGSLVQRGAGIQDMEMVKVIYILSTYSESRLNDTLSSTLSPVGIIPVDAISVLNTTLQNLSSKSIAIQMTIYTVVMTIMGLLTGTLGIVLRRRRIGHLEIEDELAISSMGLSFGYCIVLCIGTSLGKSGTHIWNISLSTKRILSIIIFTSALLYYLCEVVTKATILTYIYHVSKRPWMRPTIMVIAIFVVLTSVAGILLSVFQCAPINYWDHLDIAKCFDQSLIFKLHEGFLVIINALIIILSIPLALDIRYECKRLLFLVSSTYIIGIMILVSSVLRLIVLGESLSSADYSFEVTRYIFWTILEISLSLVLFSGPGLCETLLSNHLQGLQKPAEGTCAFKRGSKVSGSQSSKDSKASKASSHPSESSFGKIRSILGSIKRERKDSETPIVMQRINTADATDAIIRQELGRGRGTVGEWHDFTDEAERRPVRSRDGTYEVNTGDRSCSATMGSRSRSGTVGSRSQNGTVNHLPEGEVV